MSEVCPFQGTGARRGRERLDCMLQRGIRRSRKYRNTAIDLTT